jgi:hypothetical protein
MDSAIYRPPGENGLGHFLAKIAEAVRAAALALASSSENENRYFLENRVRYFHENGRGHFHQNDDRCSIGPVTAGEVGLEASRGPRSPP